MTMYLYLLTVAADAMHASDFGFSSLLAGDELYMALAVPQPGTLLVTATCQRTISA